MEKEQLKKILDALHNEKYEVKVKGPEGITQHTNYAGIPFLRLSGNESVHPIDAGACIVSLANHEYVCNLNTGVWTEGQEVLTSVPLISALSSAKGVFPGAHLSGHQLRALYVQLHDLPLDTPYCWTEGEVLKDVSDLGNSEVDIIVRYSVKDEGGWDELNVSVDDAQLYWCYRQMKRNHYLPEGDNEVELSDELIRKYVPGLYNDIIAQLEDEFSAEEEYSFSLPITLDILDATLFGEGFY